MQRWGSGNFISGLQESRFKYWICILGCNELRSGWDAQIRTPAVISSDYVLLRVSITVPFLDILTHLMGQYHINRATKLYQIS